MAATFVVETGTSSATANSYLSVADADQYHENHLAAATDWTSLSDAVKQLHLRNATRYLDAKFGRRWRGYRADEDQRLDWPRSTAVDDSGYTIDDDDLPAALEDACAVMAYADIADDLFPDISSPGTLSRVRSQLGPLVSDKTYTGGRSQTKQYALAKSLVASLIDPAGSLERG